MTLTHWQPLESLVKSKPKTKKNKFDLDLRTKTVQSVIIFEERSTYLTIANPARRIVHGVPA